MIDCRYECLVGLISRCSPIPSWNFTGFRIQTNIFFDYILIHSNSFIDRETARLKNNCWFWFSWSTELKELNSLLKELRWKKLSFDFDIEIIFCTKLEKIRFDRLQSTNIVTYVLCFPLFSMLNLIDFWCIGRSIFGTFSGNWWNCYLR